MSTYGILLLFSAIGPVLFSFNKRIRFYSQWAKVISTSLFVSIPFLIWDAIATTRGDWGFNRKYVGTLRIVGLPLEEILFFIVIPFCCLFIWWLLEKREKVEKNIRCHNWDILIGIGLTLAALILRDKFYTSTILGWAVITIVVVRLLGRNLWWDNSYWKWLAITFVPFIIVNGVLTFLPIVWYSSRAILGIRIISIPIEDFVYSWSLLTLNLVIYKKFTFLLHT